MFRITFISKKMCSYEIQVVQTNESVVISIRKIVQTDLFNEREVKMAIFGYTGLVVQKIKI